MTTSERRSVDSRLMLSVSFAAGHDAFMQDRQPNVLLGLAIRVGDTHRAVAGSCATATACVGAVGACDRCVANVLVVP